MGYTYASDPDLIFNYFLFPHLNVALLVANTLTQILADSPFLATPVTSTYDPLFSLKALKAERPPQARAVRGELAYSLHGATTRCLPLLLLS